MRFQHPYHKIALISLVVLTYLSAIRSYTEYQQHNIQHHASKKAINKARPWPSLPKNWDRLPDPVRYRVLNKYQEGLNAAADEPEQSLGYPPIRHPFYLFVLSFVICAAVSARLSVWLIFNPRNEANIRPNQKLDPLHNP